MVAMGRAIEIAVHFALLALGNDASVKLMPFDWNNLLMQEELPRTGPNAMDPWITVSAVINTPCAEGLTFLHLAALTLPM